MQTDIKSNSEAFIRILTVDEITPKNGENCFNSAG